MALSSPNSNDTLIKFRRDIITDFYRPGRFDAFMGEASTNVIVRLSELESDGYQVNVPLVSQLASPGVGTGILNGAEEIIDDFGMPLFTDFCRNGVAWNKQKRKDASFSIDSTSRSLLRNFAKNAIKNDIVDSLLSVPTTTVQPGRGSPANGGNRVNGLRWAAASAAQRNTWSDNNADRVLYGNSLSNRVAGNAASSLANVDSTNDRLTASIVSLLKRIAQATTTGGSAPAINPYMMEGTDEEWYVLFVGQRAMRDLRADPTMFQANRDARAREASNVTGAGGNPIFSGGSLVWEGVIIKEIPEITFRYTSGPGAPLSNVGASSIPVEPVFLCGQAALGFANGQVPRITGKDNTDYEFLSGVGIEAQYGIGKLAKAPTMGGPLKDFGMVTGFVAGTPDT